VLSPAVTAQLASAYELRPEEVETDARVVAQWSGSEADLHLTLEDTHGWTGVSEYATYYVAALRRTLLDDASDQDAGLGA
jgi:hypothetical protein